MVIQHQNVNLRDMFSFDSENIADIKFFLHTSVKLGVLSTIKYQQYNKSCLFLIIKSFLTFKDKFYI